MFVDPEERDGAAYRAFWEALRRGTFQAGDVPSRRRGGTRDLAPGSYNPIHDTPGRITKVVKFASDITARMRSQMEAARASTQTLSNVQAVAAASEELNASIGEIAGSLARSRQEVDEMENRARKADRSTGALADAARSMTDIVQLIQGVGGQINLLALNATIAAARAGEAGRGFAVVAGEVKNLSNQVTSATGRIAEDIKAMQSVSGDVVAALAAIGQSLDAVDQRNLHEHADRRTKCIGDRREPAGRGLLRGRDGPAFELSRLILL